MTDTITMRPRPKRAAGRRTTRTITDEWTIRLPGRPAMVPVARRYCRAFFDGSPGLESIELIAAELSANSLRHLESGEGMGGWFAVRVMRGSDWGRIEVADKGTGHWHRLLAPPDEEEERRRDLSIVSAIASGMGHDSSAAKQTMWAEVTLDAPDTPRAAFLEVDHEETIHSRTPG